MNAATFETLCQVLIPFLYLPGLFLTTIRFRSGFWWGLACFPFYFYTTAAHGQWGLVVVDVVALVLWMNGLYRAYYVEPESWREIGEGVLEVKAWFRKTFATRDHDAK